MTVADPGWDRRAQASRRVAAPDLRLDRLPGRSSARSGIGTAP